MDEYEEEDNHGRGLEVLPGNEPLNATMMNHDAHVAMLESVSMALFITAFCFSAIYALILAPRLAHLPELKQAIYTFVVLLFLYASSVSTTLYDKWLITYWDGGLRFPLGITSVHFGAKSLFTLFFLTCKRHGVRNNIKNKLPIITPVTMKLYLTVLLPMGICTGLHVAFGASAINGLSVSAATFAKTCGLPLNLMFSVGLGAAVFTKRTGLAIAVITVGFLLATLGNKARLTGTRLTGIEYVVLATVFGELKVVLTQLASQRTDDCHILNKRSAALHQLSSMELIVYTSPIAFVVLFFGFLMFESADFVVSHAFLHRTDELLGLVLLGTCIVFVLVYSAMELIRNTSSLTVATSGVFKEVMLLFLASLVFGDRVAFLQMLGIGIVSVGVMLYVRWVHEDAGVLYIGAREDRKGDMSYGKDRYPDDVGDDSDVGEGWQEYERLITGHGDQLDEGDVML